jgi:hypothetical protein
MSPVPRYGGSNASRSRYTAHSGAVKLLEHPQHGQRQRLVPHDVVEWFVAGTHWFGQPGVDVGLASVVGPPGQIDGQPGDHGYQEPAG